MNKKFTYLFVLLFICSISYAQAQNYVSQISKDSLSILNDRIEALKTSQKVYELKVEEAKEENEVEKLRVKLLEANDNAKQSASKNSKHTEKLIKGVNPKETAKLAKTARSDMENAQKALDRYNKQINKVEKLREKIKSEEQKLSYKKPTITFNH